MIVNTELEQKGNLFPSEIVNYTKDVDTLYFTTKNNVVLQLTVVRDSVIRFRYATTGKFENDFSYGITKHASRGYNFLEITEDEKNYIITTSKLIWPIRRFCFGFLEIETRSGCVFECFGFFTFRKLVLFKF